MYLQALGIVVMLLLITCGGNTVKSKPDMDSTGNDEAVTDVDFAATCGNGTIDTGEPCDGDTVQCTTIDPVKFTGGKAKCKPDCSGYDTVTCDENPAVCGNGVVEGNETCDGTIDPCIEINPGLFVGGKARCKTDCTGWETETCDTAGDYCGDKVKSGTEFCDGDSKPCVEINPVWYAGGEAPCNDTCTGYDTNPCILVQSECGDGVVEGMEVCEKETLKNCTEIDPLLYRGGKAYCLDDCSGYDTATCEENTTGTLFSDQFENGGAKWILEKDWEIGQPSYTNGNDTITTAYSGHNVLATKLTGPYSLSLQGFPYPETAIIATPITIPSGKTTILSFRAYVYTEYYVSSSDPSQNKWYDGMVVEVYEGETKLGEVVLDSENPALLGDFSIPSGGGYIAKNGVRGHSTANTYSLFIGDLTPYAGKTVTVSFLFISDYLGNYYGVAMDDVSITAQ